MPEPSIQDHVKAIIQTQVIQALNNAPEAIEKLVKAALSRECDASGKFDGYSSNKMPYLDWMVGEEIRMAARNAVIKVVQEKASAIEDEVRKGLSTETVISAFANAIVGATKDEWRINVRFDKPKD